MSKESCYSDWVFIRAGAIGYLLKDTPAEMLAEAARGESQMDPGVTRKVLNAFYNQTLAGSLAGIVK